MEGKEYQGRYRIGHHPDINRLKKHNALSWVNVEKVISDEGGVADFDALTIAVKDHESGSENAPHPYQFIRYCINNGWLVRV